MNATPSIQKQNFVLFVLLLLFTSSCGNKELVATEKKGQIEAPIPSLAKKYTEFEIDPSKENKLDLPSGTQITVPANSLVDENGKLVSGTATIKYREYHDAVDVLLSGIPMNYEVQGQKRTMQTAGMFDITGEQKGKDIFVKKEAKIQVDFASFEEGVDYNFFSLDEEKGWEFVDYVEPKVNEERKKLAKEVERLSRKINTKKENFFVFNYNAVLDVEYNNKWYDIQQNKDNKSLASKVKRYELDYFKSSLFDVINYKGNPYPADMMVWENRSKKWPSWVKKEECDLSIASIKGNLYTITARKDGKNFSAKIEAIVPLKYLFQYSPKEWKKNRGKIMKEVSAKEEKLRIELEEARKKMEQQAAVIRSFQIAGFGIYNYDKLMKEENRVDIIAEFNMGEEALDWVICLPEDGKTVIKYPKRDWDKVVLLPGNNTRFVSILPNKSVAVYSVEEYQKIDFESLKNKTSKPKQTFTLVKVIESVNSEEEIRGLLDNKV